MLVVTYVITNKSKGEP